MDARTVNSLKNHCEEWLIKCIICHCCGKLPQSLWKCGCDHLFCDLCKSIKKCDVCAFPFTGRSKKNKGPVREHIYDKLIESAHELVTLLNINVSSLVKKFSEHSEPVPEDDSIIEVPVEVPKLRTRQRIVAQKSTSKAVVVKAKISEEAPPVRGRRRKRGAATVSAAEIRKSPRKHATSDLPSPKKPKLNTSNETSAGMDETVFDFKSDEEEEKKVKRATKTKEKGDTACDSSKRDNKDRVESLKQESRRLRARSTSTIKSESIKSRNSSPKNSIVLLATSLSKVQMSELYKFRKQFHCTVKETYDNDVTHVICKAVEDNYTSRTIKYLHGLVGNKWLLSYDWIDDSIREGEILDEERYELRGTCKDKETSNGAPKKSRTTQKKLFKDYVAYFEGKFVPQSIPPKDDLVRLFKSAGGTVIDTTYKLNANIKKKQKLIVIREDNQEASAATKSLKAINVADFLSMITEFDVNDEFVNFA